MSVIEGGASVAAALAAHVAAWEFYAARREDSWAQAYIESRGLGELAHKFGYAPRGPRALITELGKAGYTEEQLLEYGLASKYEGKIRDAFRDRVVAPIYGFGDHGQPQIVGFIGRAKGKAQPKYVNTATTLLYSKTALPYGLVENAAAIQAGAGVVFVEGVFDAEDITTASQGQWVGVAIGGVALRPEHIALLGSVVDLAQMDYRIVVATDQDTAGRQAAAKAWGVLADAGIVTASGLRLGEKDPAEIFETDGPQALRAALQSNLVPLIADLVENKMTQWGNVLDHIDGQLGFVRSIAPAIRRAAPEQRHYAAAQIINALELDADIIQRELTLSTDPDEGAPSPDEDGEEPRRNVSYMRTDVGNSYRLIDRHQKAIRYVSDVGHWMTWGASSWMTDPDRAAMMRRAVESIKSIYTTAAGKQGDDVRAADMTWAMKSESRRRLQDAVALAEIDERVRCQVRDLDADPMLLGAANGTVDLRTGRLRDSDPADLITHQAPVAYDPDAECPRWLATLERIMPDPEMRSFLQRCIGYSLTGSTNEQVMFVAYGRGQNGKSVVVDTLATLLGGYAQKAPPELLMAQNNDSGVSNDVARLRGARAVSVVETEEGRRLAEAKVKELTGGDVVTARFLHKEFFEFKPVAKLWLVTNHRPKITGTDEGIWRRLVMLPFPTYITPEERDKELTTKLLRELPGILAWAVRGCLEWQKTGLAIPATSLAAAAEYRVEQDILGAFLADCTVSRENVSARASALYAAYTDWCQRGGHRHASQTTFGSKLSERGYEKFRTNGITWRGIGLLSTLNDDDPGPDDDDPGPGRGRSGPDSGGSGGPDGGASGPGGGAQPLPWTGPSSAPGGTAVAPPAPTSDAAGSSSTTRNGEQQPAANTPAATVPSAPQAGGAVAAPVAVPPREQWTKCRVCGEPCHPVAGEIHPSCEEDQAPPTTAAPAAEPTIQRAPASTSTPAPAITDAASSSAPVAAGEPAAAAAGGGRPLEAADRPRVTRRQMRPWTPRSTAYIVWSSGRGVTDDQTAVEVPKAAPLDRFLSALPAGIKRVVLIGAMPGKTGPGLQDWATGRLPEGWGSGAHYLEPESMAARYVRPNGDRVDIHRLASWTREGGASGRVRPQDAAAAFALFREGLAAMFDMPVGKDHQRASERDPALAPAVLASPASTGRELLLRSLPAGTDFPVLEDEHRDLLHHTTGQGRNELFFDQHGAELPGLYVSDMRWSYAGLCRGVRGAGPAMLDSGSEFLGFEPARYEIEFTVPRDWDHIGLLSVAGHGFPAEPGSTWTTWADARELRLADKWGWSIGDMRIKRRLRFANTKAEPLRTWADKLVELRQEWLPAQDATTAVIELARDFTRTTLLAGLGALYGRRQRLTHSVSRDRAAEVPRDVEAHLAGDQLVWTTETSAAWLEMVHPEWPSQVWAGQRCYLLDSGPKANQPNVGALHLPKQALVALRTDAIYSTTDPGWPDPGRVGQFRSQLAIDHPVATPRTLDELLQLRGES